MKIDDLESLASEMNLSNILIKPSDVIISMEGKGDLKDTFPVPDCPNCAEKCCPPRVVINLFDIVRFIDNGLDKFIAGRFEGFIELFLSETSEDVKLYHPHMNPVISDAKDCVFMDEERLCSIYENRPCICRSYPVVIRIDEDRNKLALWLGGCKNFNISSDKAAFNRLLESAVYDYNEKLIANAVLMNKRNELREIGLGKYLEDDWQVLLNYNKKSKDMQLQVQDLQKTVERLRAPQDYMAIVQSLQGYNDWLKGRVENLEKELSQQREQSHSIISELTAQLGEQRKLIGNLQSDEEPRKKGIWRK